MLKKIRAYKKLFEIAKEGSFDVYFTLSGFYGKDTAKPLRCLDPIIHGKDRQLALNETLCRLAKGDPARSMERLEEERRIIQLVLTAGADPNCSSHYGMPDESILQSFMSYKKTYGALEVAKADSFMRPKTLDNTFNELVYSLDYYLQDGQLFPDFWDTAEEYALYKRDVADKIKLVCVLFDKGMYPSDPKVRQLLQPIYEEEQKRIQANASNQMKKGKATQKQIVLPDTKISKHIQAAKSSQK